MLAFDKDHDLINNFMRVWHEHIRSQADSYLSLFSEREVQVLAAFGRKRLLAKGQTLFSQGDVARSLALVLAGKLDVYITPSNQDDTQGSETDKVKKGQWIASISVGETVGEMTLITDGKGDMDGKRNATVRSSNVLSTVIVFDYNDFATFIFDQLHQERAIKIRTMMRDMVIARLYPKELKPWQEGSKVSPKKAKVLRRSISHIDATVDMNKLQEMMQKESETTKKQNVAKKSLSSLSEDADTKIDLDETASRQAPSPTKMNLKSLLSGAVTSTSQHDAFPLLDDEGSLHGSTLSKKSFSRKSGKIDPDNPWNCPTTIVNIDALLECLWLAKFGEKELTTEAKEVNDDVLHVPHTAIFHEGEMVQWYFGTGGSMKKRSKERMVAWALIEEFCGKKGSHSTDSHRIVATMVTWRPGKDRESEFVQCRLLDKRRLESVVNGAKTNSFTGILQKYVSTATDKNQEDDEQQVLQCTWTPISCSIEVLDEAMLECFTETHKSARILPNKKTLRARMRVQFHHFVPGQLSMFGDHLTSTQITSRPILTAHVASAAQRIADREAGKPREKSRNKSFAARRSASADMWQTKAVPLQMRESVKMACARIAASMQSRINSSKNAQRKADLIKSIDGSKHDTYFSQVMSMSCLFKVKQGITHVLHCDVAMSHPDTKPAMSLTSKMELMKPTQEKFNLYSQFGLSENRLSAQGLRATTMDFTEFSRYLAAVEILYKHVSLTQASWVFAQALRPADGNFSMAPSERELNFPLFVKAMRIIANLLEVEVPEEKPSAGAEANEGSATPISTVSKAASLQGKAAGQTAKGGLESVAEEAGGGKKGGKKGAKDDGTKKGLEGSIEAGKRPFGGGPGPGIDTHPWGWDPKDGDVRKPWVEQKEAALKEAKGGNGGIHKLEPVPTDDHVTVNIDSLRKYEAVERVRLGRMFAADLVQRQEEVMLEEKQRETGEKHNKLISDRQVAVREQLVEEQRLAKLRLEAARQRFQAQSEAEQERARQKWTKVQENSQKLEESRRRQMEERRKEADERMQRRDKQVAESERYHQEKRNDYLKKSQMIDDMHLRMSSKKARMQETRRRFWDKIAREKEVVGELFDSFIHTGKLHRPWGAVDLDGDAIPTVFEVATMESQPLAISPGQSTLHLPKGRMRVSGEKLQSPTQ